MYATVEQANLYVSEFYSSSDSISVLWFQLSDEDKQVLLNRAAQTINQLPYSGRAEFQDRAFPRHPNKEMSLVHASNATIELALQRNGNIEKQERLALQAQGIKSYKIGDLSETYQDGIAMIGVDNFAISVVSPFLLGWLGGGYNICHTRTRK